MVILAITGYSQSGKDSLVNIIKELHPEICHLKYSDWVKTKVGTLYPEEFNSEKWESSSVEYRDKILPTLGMSRREFLINKGVELSNSDPGEYITCMTRQLLHKYTSGVPYCVISDVRTQMEIQNLKDLEVGKNIKVQTLYLKRDKSLRIQGLTKHEIKSKTSNKWEDSITLIPRDSFDYNLTNEGTLEDLKFKFKNFNIFNTNE